MTWENVDCLDHAFDLRKVTLMVNGTRRKKRASGRRSRRARRGRSWSSGLRVRAGGTGTVAHAGVVLPRLLADRLGVTSELGAVMDRAGFVPLRCRGRVLVDTACALAAGASCLTDVEAMTGQVEIFGTSGGASDSTLWRVLGELSERISDDGLPGRRFAGGMARVRARAWAQIAARHSGLPAVRVAGRDLTRRVGEVDRVVTVVRVDATVIHAADTKEGSEPNFKGCGFHPLSAWCSNTGEALAVMQRRGSAGSFTAADHIAVLDAAIAQIPSSYRRDVLVTLDGAGASHALIEHVNALNTEPVHGRRGRRVEYSIGWPVDERTRAALDLAPEQAWGPGLHADGTLDEDAQVIDLTGLLRASMHGETLLGWAADPQGARPPYPPPRG